MWAVAAVAGSVAAVAASHRLEAARRRIERSAGAGAARADDQDVKLLARLERRHHLTPFPEALRILASVDERLKTLDLPLERRAGEIILLRLPEEDGADDAADHEAGCSPQRR